MSEQISGFQIVKVGEEFTGTITQDEFPQKAERKTELLQGQEILLSEPSQTEQPHAHHWIIDEPNGEFSTGCCKNCDAQREFSNRPPGDADFNTRSEYVLGFGY